MLFILEFLKQFHLIYCYIGCFILYKCINVKLEALTEKKHFENVVRLIKMSSYLSTGYIRINCFAKHLSLKD